MLTKSPLCKSTALTGMTYISESSEYSGINFHNMESHNMTSISVISSRKEISSCQEDSMQCTAQQSRFTYYHSGSPEEASGRPSVFKKVPKHLSRHQPQGTHVCIDVRTA
jgi:hypothetical protein